jgi:hypothetical protein
MEAVIVGARTDRVAVRRGTDVEFIEDVLIFEDFAQLGLHGVVEHDGVDRFPGVADVPDLNCQVIAGIYIFSILTELCAAVAGQILCDETLLAGTLALEVDRCIVRVGCLSEVA